MRFYSTKHVFLRLSWFLVNALMTFRQHMSELYDGGYKD